MYVVLMLVRSWLPRNKMLTKYPFAVKHVFRFRQFARLIAFSFYFSLRSVVSSSSTSPCCGYYWRYSIKSNQFISVTSIPQHKTTQRTVLSLRSHSDLSVERVCLGTNIADSTQPPSREKSGGRKPRIGLRGYVTIIFFFRKHENDVFQFAT